MANQGGLLTEILHPFGGAGGITSTGAAYGTTVSSAGSTSFIEVEEVLIRIPEQAQIIELEVGLTMGLAITTTTDGPKVTYNIKNSANSTYDVLKAVVSDTLISIVSTTTLVDHTEQGIADTPSDGTQFTGNGSFQIQATVAANVSTSNALGAMKQTSFLIVSYYIRG